MVHLRIVVPSHQSGHALDLLENTPSVCNLIYLERAAQRPEGDVILCDVAREDASVIVSDLRELEIDKEGSIAMEDIDSQISEVLDSTSSQITASEGIPAAAFSARSAAVEISESMSSIAIDPVSAIPNSFRSPTITLASSRATSQRITSPSGCLLYTSPSPRDRS